MDPRFCLALCAMTGVLATRGAPAFAQVPAPTDLPLSPTRDEIETARRVASILAQRCAPAARVEVVWVRMTFASSGRDALPPVVGVSQSRRA